LPQVFSRDADNAAGIGDWDLLFQWMTGSTVVCAVMNGAHDVDTEFDSKYLMLTWSYDRHR
jgi:hypothetical protein